MYLFHPLSCLIKLCKADSAKILEALYSGDIPVVDYWNHQAWLIVKSNHPEADPLKNCFRLDSAEIPEWVYEPETMELVQEGEELRFDKVPETRPPEDFIGIYDCYLERLEKLLEGIEWFERNHQKPEKSRAESTSTGTRGKGGANYSPLTEAVKWAYKELLKTGNTMAIEEGNVKIFIQHLRDCTTDGNRNFSNYVAERIKEVKNIRGEFFIIMNRLTMSQLLEREKTGKVKPYTQSTISNKLSNLRKETLKKSLKNHHKT